MNLTDVFSEDSNHACVTAKGKGDWTNLGAVELNLEGQPIKALVDTGSPVTIVSIDCLLDVLAKNRKTDQTKD